MKRNPKLARAYELARNDIGTVEWRDGHNPKVVRYFSDVGHSWVKDDETAWCAAFTGAMLDRSGLPSTRKLNARSYLEWGVAVDIKNALPGDVVVFWRGSPDGWQGHVAQYVSHNETHVTVLGGNQSNAVNEKPYPISQLLGVRTMYSGNGNGGNNMDIDVKASLEVAHHESVVRQAYKDGGGVWTWSVGLTNSSGHNVERYIDNPQSMTKCLEVFVWALGKYAKDVNETFEGVDLTQEQFAAALSFHWNTGAIKRASWVKDFKAGDVDKAKRSFMNWKKPNSIIPRRRAERDLFFDGVWSGDGKTTEYTRLTPSKQPDWGSAVRVDISKEIGDLLGAGKKVAPSGANGGSWIVGVLRSIFG